MISNIIYDFELNLNMRIEDLNHKIKGLYHINLE